ncbi:triosephosphate isomerase [Candidatus Pacearchaeota archaeon]|nr:triosephosphate isomerase [Candidatus Pacearchaeota archaeon]
MKKPIIIVNLKTYQQGSESVRISKKIDKVSSGIIVGVQSSDIYEVCKKTKLKVYSQHVDYYEPGRYTGYIIPEAVKRDGAIGTFLNHSEHPLKLKVIKKTVLRCKKIGLKTAVFTKSLREAKKIEKFSPDYLIYEPPELVGGDISVTTSKPELIEKIVKSIKMPILVGAGVKTYEDIKKCMELGSVGIAVSSAITKAKNPGKALKELIGEK